MASVCQRKVAIAGAGAVGSTFAYALAQSGLVDEIVLIDQNKELAYGQAMDLAHGDPFFPTVSIRDGNSSDYGDSHLIVITAGTAQQPGETRLDLLRRNAGIIRSIVADVVKQNSAGVMLIASNPVGVMTYVAIQSAGSERGRVFGSGTILDSARLRYFISGYCGVDIHNVHAYILGEHGDSEFAAWSMAHIAGMPIDEFCLENKNCSDWTAERNKIEQKVRNSAYRIIERKGNTCFAIGLALVRITGAILRGERSVLSVSTMLDGEFGLKNVCLSVPCIVSTEGVEMIFGRCLQQCELTALHASATVLREAIERLDV